MLRTTLTAAAMTLAAGAASAITVDNFNTIASDTQSGVAGTVASISDAGGLGSGRVIEAEIDSLANMMAQNGQITVNSGGLNPGRFEYEASSGVNGSLTMSYSGLGGVDLAALPLQLVAVTNDSAFDLTIEVTSGTGLGAVTDSDSFVIADDNEWETILFDLSNITTASSADEIVLTFVAEDHGGDISFSEISQIPVPAAGVLLIGALGGMAALRRRKAA